MHGRESFRVLRKNGIRRREGPIVLTFAAPEGPAGPSVAYAVGRSVGSAVVRNRVRRRLREIMHAEAAADGLPPGLYLISVAPPVATMSFQELSTIVHRALRTVRGLQ